MLLETHVWECFSAFGKNCSALKERVPSSWGLALMRARAETI